MPNRLWACQLRRSYPLIEKRNSTMTIKNGNSLLVVLVMLVSRPLFAEQMSIDRQIKLSPGHAVQPNHITRASNGDLIIFGSNSELGFSRVSGFPYLR